MNGKVFIGGAGRKAGGAGDSDAAPVMKTRVELNRFGQAPGLCVLLGWGWLEWVDWKVGGRLVWPWIGLAEPNGCRF